MKKRVVIFFDNFGPYHRARLKTVSEEFELLAVEFGASSSEYAWSREHTEDFRSVAVNGRGAGGEIPRDEFFVRMGRILESFGPEVVFVPGWASRGALLALLWCVKHQVPAVVMSESTAWDGNRNPLKESIKKRIIQLFSAGLVGGSPQRDYLQQLGMSHDRVFLGYDTIDNAYFEQTSDLIRLEGLGTGGSEEISANYFLVSARFIPKKNLHRLIEAYSCYRKKAVTLGYPTKSASGAKNQTANPWNLLLLGDGPLRGELEAFRSRLGIERYVHMPGFKQYAELPRYYANAGALIHASTTEQWGLVVNEAMAAGLPVLVSNRCGCASDLVQEGANGWTFEPKNPEQLAILMGKLASDAPLRTVMGHKSREIISGWSLARFREGVYEAMESARRNFRPQRNYFFQTMLRALSR